MMKPFHHKQLPVHHIVDLVDRRGRLWDVGIVKQDLPPRLFPLYPFPHSLTIVRSRQMCHIFDESSQSLPQRAVVRRFARVVDEKDLSELTAECLTNRLGHPFDLGRQLEGGMQHAVGELSKGEQSPKTQKVLSNPSVSIPCTW